jgi:hypothetical protein
MTAGLQPVSAGAAGGAPRVGLDGTRAHLQLACSAAVAGHWASWARGCWEYGRMGEIAQPLDAWMAELDGFVCF